MSSVPPADDVIVDVRDVHYAIGGRPIFAGLNIQVRKGRITAIMGPSGTGKTTLLRLITGQIAPDRGQVLVWGQDLAQAERARDFRAAQADGHAVPERRVAHRSRCLSRTSPFPCASMRDLPEELIRKLVLAQAARGGAAWGSAVDAMELSGGMARRVALARAIVMDPEMLIYDEPFVGLDPISLGVIVRLIAQMNKGLGITSVVVSHDVHELANIAHDSYLLSEGESSPRERPKSCRRAISKWCSSS